jgi:hypothetical protein
MTLPFVLSISGGPQLHTYDPQVIQFPLLPETIGSSGDGKSLAPNVPESFPFRADYYRSIRRYCGQEHGSRLFVDSAFVSITRPTSVSDALREETLGQIGELLCLKDGWDGYGGYSPSASACEYARGVVARLASDFPELPSPEIGPTSNGTLTLSWRTSLGSACIEVGDESFSAYIRYKGHFIPIKGACADLGADELQLISSSLYQ